MTAVPLALAIAAPTRAAVLTVPDDCPTIQQAVTAAQVGDTVHVRPGTYYENVTIDRSLNLQGESRDTTIVDGGGAGPVVYITANYVAVSGLTVRNGDWGIKLIPNYAIHHVTISDCVITANLNQGIHAGHNRSSGAHHLVEGCTISNNGGNAIAGALYAHQFSRSTVRKNDVFGNAGGIDIAWGSDSLVTDNSVHDNLGHGIWLDAMRHSTVEGNEVFDNGGIGIVTGYAARENTIRENIVRRNQRGTSESGSIRYVNYVYHNDFIDNLEAQAVSAADTRVVFDIGYPGGGNYWNDYAGIDMMSGEYQDEPGSDGIGDTPYVFLRNADRYPLMHRWNTIEVMVDIKPGSYPNTFNQNEHGVIPVALFGSEELNVEEIDVITLQLQGLLVKMAGRSGNALAHVEYLNDDDHPDLVVQFEDSDAWVEPGESIAEVRGELLDGTPISGSDTIQIVP